MTFCDSLWSLPSRYAGLCYPVKRSLSSREKRRVYPVAAAAAIPIAVASIPSLVAAILARGRSHPVREVAAIPIRLSTRVAAVPFWRCPRFSAASISGLHGIDATGKRVLLQEARDRSDRRAGLRGWADERRHRHGIDATLEGARLGDGIAATGSSRRSARALPLLLLAAGAGLAMASVA